jgi:hypothetical protein
MQARPFMQAIQRNLFYYYYRLAKKIKSGSKESEIESEVNLQWKIKTLWRLR